MLSSALNRKTAKSSFFFHQFSKSSTTKKSQEYQEWGVNLKFYLKGKAAQRLVHSLTFLRTWQSIRNFSRSQFPHPKSGREKSQLPKRQAAQGINDSSSEQSFHWKQFLPTFSNEEWVQGGFTFSPVSRKFCYTIEHLQKILLWVSSPAGKDLEAFNIRIFLLTAKATPSSRESWLKFTRKGVGMVRWGTCSSGIENMHDQH